MYPNMSYCAFENTGRAIDQLIAMLLEATDECEKLDFSHDEQRAYNELRDKMADLVQVMDEYEDMLQEYEELKDEP